MRAKVLSFCVLSVLGVPAFLSRAPAQTAPLSAITNSTVYADEPIVAEHVDTVISMAADGTGWKEHTFVARLQSDAAVKRYGVLSVPYASSSEHVVLAYARVRHPDGTVGETQTTDAMDMPTPVTRQAPFYSDQKELQLPIRSLRVGDTLEFKYRVVQTKAEAPGQFWGREIFSDTMVVLSQTFELRVPPGMYVNVWSPSIKPVVSDSPATADTPAQHIYRWTYSQLKPTAGKDAEAAAAAKKKILWTADQELDLEQGRLPTIAWTTFKSWAEIGAWYRSLETDRIVPDDTVKAKAAELTAGKSTDEAKARALYDYVATNIRYIGVAFGIGRFQPHTAAEILANQYGDCKDKHTLLAALLAAEGIQVDAVLIGSGIRFNEAVPSPASFNHLITHLTLSAAPGQPPRPIWLDTTAEVVPFGMLTITTRDKQSLVVPSAASAVAVVVRTPLEPLVASGASMDAVGSLDATGVSTSHIVLTFRGDGEFLVRTAFRIIPADQYESVVQKISSGIGFTGTATNPEISRPTDTTQPFKLAYDYKREKAGDWDNLRTIAQVMPVALPRVADIDPPVHAILLGGPRTEDSTSSMKLPEGWSAILPAAVHVKCAYGTYDMTYRFENGTVYAERHLAILAKKVPVDDWKAYKDWVDKVNPGREPYIRLVNPTAQAGTPGVLAAKPPEQRTKQIEDALGNPDPKVKIQVAGALVNINAHLSDAQTLAEQAVQLQEQATSQVVSTDAKVASFDQMGLLGADWEILGRVYYREGQQEKAETYMHAAWELRPRNADINLYMGLINEAQHRPTDATKFYRMALSITPSPTLQSVIQARFDHLGVTAVDPLPVEVITPLPALDIQLNPADPEPRIDILLERGKPPVIAMVSGDPALEKPLAAAIQPALADGFPDSGPEKLLRRARVACSSGEKSVCALHFLGSQEARNESSRANKDSAGR